MCNDNKLGAIIILINIFILTMQTKLSSKTAQSAEEMTLEEILERLNMKSIDQLLSLDSMDIQKMAHR